MKKILGTSLGVRNCDRIPSAAASCSAVKVGSSRNLFQFHRRYQTKTCEERTKEKKRVASCRLVYSLDKYYCIRNQIITI